MFLMLAILSSRSFAVCVFLSVLRAADSSCLFRLLISSSAFLYASARSSYSFLAEFLASLIFYSASLVLLSSLKARCISTVPIFVVPCARAAIGKTSANASIVDRDFFIKWRIQC